MTRSVTLALVSFALVTGLAVTTVPAGAATVPPTRAKTSPITWHAVSIPSGSLLLGGQPALGRDGGGNLHAIFTTNSYQYWDAKFTPLGAASGSVHKVFSSSWSGLSQTPWLVPGTKTAPMQLVFSGQRGTPDVYNNGCLYGATSATGATWTLSTEAYASSCVNFPDASTTMIGSTPYTAWKGPGDGFTYHVGAGPSIPAGGSDSTVSLGVGDGSCVGNSVTALDAKGGAHLAIAGFDGLATHMKHNGTYLWDTSIGTGNHVRKAPSSSPFQANSQRVAMVSGGTGHLPFVAYCTGTTTSLPQCTGVRLWNVLNNTTIGLGGSKGATLVAASAGPAGRVWVAFYKPASTGPGTVTVARTNQAVTKFGPERTFKAPPLFTQATLAIEGSAGRLDIFMDGVATKGVTMYHAQVLAPLSLKASKTSLPTSGGSITFTVLDAGRPVQGAKVSLLGKSGTTGTKGTVTLKFGKTKAGTYIATAKKAGYAGAKLKIRFG